MRILLVLGFFALAACSPRGAITLDPAAAMVGEVTPIFVGTTRELEAGKFGSQRSEEMHFARYDISIPPIRDMGQINWPSRLEKPNPKRHFLTTNEVLYPQNADFRTDLRRQLAANGNEAVIFIHGFNNNFSEGLYRIAQFSHDLQLPGAVVHYAWPSAAKPLGYVYDRDSSLFARDGLEDLLDEVAKAGAKRVLLVAHSMGSNLAMETLRQIAIRNNHRVLDRLAGVILISPDIDVELFRMQAHAIGKLPQPFMIVGSDRDKMLGLSARLTGQTERLGSLSDISRVADLKVTFVDVSDFSEGVGHFTLGDSPALIKLVDGVAQIEGAFEADRARRIGLISGAVLTVQNATQIVLSPVAEIAAGVNQ